MNTVPLPLRRCMMNPSPPNMPARSRFLNANPTRTPRVPPRNAPFWQISAPPTLSRSTAMILPGEGAANDTRRGCCVLLANTEVKKFSPVSERLNPADRRLPRLESSPSPMCVAIDTPSSAYIMAPGSPMAESPGARVSSTYCRSEPSMRYCHDIGTALPGVFTRPQTTGLPRRGHPKVEYYWRDEILFMERQRHPRRGPERHFSEVRRRAQARHTLPAGNQGGEGTGRDRPARLLRVLELGREERLFGHSHLLARGTDQGHQWVPGQLREEICLRRRAQARLVERRPRDHRGVSEVLRRHGLHAQCQGRSVAPETAP